MDPRVSSLNGLHYKDNSYFDFVVAERPMYTPGCGPALAPISVLPPHDKDGIILEKTFVDKALRYIIGYKDEPHLRHSVKAQDLLKYVSPRTFEQWESEDYDRREREAAELELPKILAKEKAKAKRLEKLSRGDGPHIDGRRKRRKLIQDEDQDQSSTEFEPPRKRGKPGRPRKSSSRSNLQIVLPSSPIKSPPQPNFTTPRRLSQHSTAGQPSLSTPVRMRGLNQINIPDSEDQSETDAAEQPSLSTPRRVRGLNEVNVPDSEDLSETDEESIEVDLALEAQLNGMNGTREPSAAASSSPSSLMGGAVAKTSARDALTVYESIEKSHVKSDKMTLERSPFKKPILPNRTITRQKYVFPVILCLTMLTNGIQVIYSLTIDTVFKQGKVRTTIFLHQRTFLTSQNQIFHTSLHPTPIPRRRTRRSRRPTRARNRRLGSRSHPRRLHAPARRQPVASKGKTLLDPLERLSDRRRDVGARKPCRRWRD
jgi:hypothetical protein